YSAQACTRAADLNIDSGTPAQTSGTMSELIGLAATGLTLFVAGLGLVAAVLLFGAACVALCWGALPRNNPVEPVNEDGGG
ncbi:MAG TPA: hypothetical protein VHN20_00310, partial [Beijerinckiaceae bacterium]|nr:hypothetical protein [Beijerinckiaceae bacterium]